MENVVFDNTKFIMEKITPFKESSYRHIKVIIRPKKSDDESVKELVKIYGSHVEKVVWDAMVASEEDYYQCIAFGKFLCDLIPCSRMYMTSNLKHIDAASNELMKKTTDFFTSRYVKKPSDVLPKLNSSCGNGGDWSSIKFLSSLSKSVASSPNSNYGREYSYTMLDFDTDIENGIDKTKLNDIVNSFIKKMAFKDFIKYFTPNGIHLFLGYSEQKIFLNPNNPEHDIYEEFLEQYEDTILDVKKDAMMLLYARG